LQNTKYRFGYVFHILNRSVLYFAFQAMFGDRTNLINNSNNLFPLADN